MDSLPQELIDEIINHLPPRDNKSFRYCSLVARSWRYTSQKRLVEFIEARAGWLRQLLDDISQSSGVLLQQVRSLTCSREKLWAVGPTYDALSNHFRSLNKLENFTLRKTYLRSVSLDVELFAAFKLALSTITLELCTVSISALVVLINYFPKLECLCLRGLSCDELDEEAPPIFRPLLGRLYISEGYRNVPDLLDELWNLGLRVDEVAFEPVFVSGTQWTTFANRVVRTFGTSAKRLRLPKALEGMWNLH